MSELSMRVLTDPQERRETVVQLCGYAFSPTPPLPTDWNDWFGGTTNSTLVAMLDGDKPVALVASTPMMQNVRGKMAEMSGVWGVASHPGYRRRGFIRDAMVRLLEVGQAQGHSFTTLYPFRASFYGRMGYVTFPHLRNFRFNPSDLATVSKMPLRGHVELMLLSEGWDIYRAFMERYQACTHGLAITSEPAIFSEKSDKVWLAVAIVDGEPQGMMHYNIKGEEDDMTINARNFYTLDVMARYLLLDWFARHYDQVLTVKLRLAPYDRAETWTYEMPTTATERGWPPMGRVLDVAKIGGLQVGPGSLTVRISDPMGPWNEGVWTLASEEGTLTVMAADDSEAECNLTIQALSALVYGTHDPDLFTLRGWGDPSPEMQARMRALFPLMQPYLHEEF